MRKILTICICISYLSIYSYGQDQWTIYKSPDLPNNTVTKVAFENDGTIWTGSSAGLSCYDGTNWKTFKKENSGLPYDWISAIAFDSEGNKWIGTEGGGLARFSGSFMNPGEWTTYSYWVNPNQLPSDMVYTVTVGNDGSKWIGTRAGLTKFSGGSWTTYSTNNSQLHFNDISFITIDLEGVLWIGNSWTNSGLTSYESVNGWNVYKASNPVSSSGMPLDNVSEVVVDKNNIKWIATPGGGLVKYDGKSMVTYNTSNSNIASNYLSSIAIESTGVIWVGTQQSGISRFDGVNWKTYNVLNSSIPTNRINAIRIDKEGNKWIGTHQAGLVKFKEGTVSVGSDENELNKEFSLNQNFPNPFNPETTISFVIPAQVTNLKNFSSNNSFRNENVYVTLKVYDVLGKEVATIVDEEKQPGVYTVKFNMGRIESNISLSTGVYFYRLNAGDFSSVKKMMFIK